MEVNHERQIGCIAVDFFLNLIAVALLVSLPTLVSSGGAPSSPAVSEVVASALQDLKNERAVLMQQIAENTSRLEAQSLEPQPQPLELDHTQADKLRRRMAELSAENDALVQRIEKAKAAMPEHRLGVPIATRVEKHALFMFITDGRLTPVDESTGRFVVEGRANGNTARRFQADAAGEPPSALTDPSSRVARAINALDPAKSFVFALLADDSFDVFYTLRAHLHSKGIDLGWDPDPSNGKRTVAFSSTGASPTSLK